MMTGGAAFDSATYNNSFTLIRVGKDRFTYCTFEFDPLSGTENGVRRSGRRILCSVILLCRERPAAP